MIKTHGLVIVLSMALLPLLGGCGNTSEDSAIDPDEAFLSEVQERASDLTTASSTAGAISAGNGLPIIEFETQRFEMGVIANNELAHREMKVYNRGTAPLRITRVTTSCGCTTGKMRNSVIPPGGTGILEITVDPARIPGFYAVKTLTLYNDDPKNPIPTLQVVTHVEPETEIIPSRIELGDLAHGTGAEAVVHIRQLQEKPMKFSTVTLRQRTPYIEAKLEEVPEDEWQVAGKREYRIRATLSSDAPPGVYNDVIYVHTDLSRQPQIPIPFTASVTGVYRIQPKRLSLRDVKPGETYEGVLSIISDKPIEILEFTHANENIQVERRAGSKPNTYIFDLIVPEQPNGRLQRDTWTMKIRADGEEFTETVDVSVVMSRSL